MARSCYFVKFTWHDLDSRPVSVVKIGHSKDIDGRLKQLTHGAAAELLGAFPGGEDREAEEHERWAHCRLFSEYFRPEADLIRHAKGLPHYTEAQWARVRRGLPPDPPPVGR
jgi:hypothetical protein